MWLPAKFALEECVQFNNNKKEQLSVLNHSQQSSHLQLFLGVC